MAYKKRDKIMERYLKYCTEAAEWIEGLPVGNGRLAQWFSHPETVTSSH